ncbi:zeta toxin family protein [Candidatus Saccharibacteria bacterium]|nr:zeta toxin family protein [Candidatus Saccharibacteria bacterium]
MEEKTLRAVDGTGRGESVSSGSMDERKALAQVVEYMKAHWPSPVKPEWQVTLDDYPAVLERVINDFTKDKTRGRCFVRIAGLSGSGKTSQILPAVEAYVKEKALRPVLVAARLFVEYHPYYQEILSEYGEANLRKMTDEFSTIMMFLVLNYLTKSGFDVVLDVTLLDPAVEQILLGMLKRNRYSAMLLMIATSPVVTEHFLGGRGWRHTKETEAEFIRATKKALEFYALKAPEMRVILWSVYDLLPVYDGKMAVALGTFEEYSGKTELPAADDDARRAAKIKYMEEMARK